ncbi:hypothetical protein ILUMI_20678 [Ignelater luminosus]|uniref:GAG-pre-integrase domain-containing protein n=1 Tax=Ignelater luminosus TaxID=2038154 RepID=A0A8K0CJB0_IGNLU|nr:hypothetical protein ILUMI_20678 [Ignelater luminosus]
MFPQQTTKAPHRNALIDSGCNSHMTSHIKYFSQYTPYTSSNNLVKIGDGRLLEAKGIGDIQVIVTVKGEIIESVLKNVLYVPELHLNLFSLGVCMEKGYSVQGGEDIIYLKKNDKLYVEAIKNKNLFVINMKVDTRENCEDNNLLAGYASGIRSIQDWHERLAHQNFQHVRSLLKSLNIEFKDDKNAFCEYCLQGKQCRQPFRISTTEVNELLSDIKVKKLGIRAQTQKTAPKYVKNQERRAKTGLRKIYKKTLRKPLVIDDETYVVLEPEGQPGRKYVHSKNHDELSFQFKFKRITKFPNIYLVWQAIDENGNVSEPYVTNKSLTADIYLKECLKKQLLPFLLKHHNKEEILFWSDLATCRYAKVCLEILTQEKLEFIGKHENPPNAPQARGIEKFWALCKQRYSEQKNTAKNIGGFKRIWNKISKNVAEELGKTVMDHAYKYLREIGYKGIQNAMCSIYKKQKH